MPMGVVSGPSRAAWRLVGWLPALGGAAGIACLLFLARLDEWGLLPAARAVEIALPLAAAIHAAFVFSPEDEEPLELLLSAPRSAAWILGERLLLLAVLHGAVGLAGTLACRWVLGAAGPAWLLLARWLAPAVFMVGVAVSTTIVTRQGLLSALVTLLLWGGLLLGGDALLSRFSFLWPIHPYLQPAGPPWSQYGYNRLALILIGLGLVVLAGHLVSDEERTLGLRQSRQRG